MPRGRRARHHRASAARRAPHPRRRRARAGARCCSDWPHAEFNIEGNPFHNLMDFVRELRPHQCTFVPDSAGQFTCDHGWDLPDDAERLRPLIAEAQALGVRVSLFMDPLPAAMARPRGVGADRVELYTESLCQRARHAASRLRSLARYAAAAQAAQARRAGRQRRPRPEPRQPGRLPARRAGRARGLDRPRADRRRAGTRAMPRRCATTSAASTAARRAAWTAA